MDFHLSDALAGLSHALDITEGHPPGHAERSCVIGMRIADAIELPESDRTPLYYALLLKDAGCSVTSAPLASTYKNDDNTVKAAWRGADDHSAVRNALFAWKVVAPGGSALAKLGRIRALLTSDETSIRTLTELRCERGAEVVLGLGLEPETADAVRSLDERWDGGGYPLGLAGEAIPQLARVMSLAQTLEVFWSGGGPAAAQAMAAERRGRWFDPALVDAVLAADADFWAGLEQPDVRAIEPLTAAIAADEQRLDAVAVAFGQIVDAKSPYTGHHSRGVAELAARLASALGLGEAEARRLYRAGQLHDLGKLGVSNRILDKPGKLDEAEWTAVRRHPATGHAILSRIPALADMARLALTHHERLDGSGYPYGIGADALTLADRILAVADVAEALSAERPYRGSLTTAEVLEIMERDAGTKLDPDAFRALRTVLPQWRGEVPSNTAPGGEAPNGEQQASAAA